LRPGVRVVRRGRDRGADVREAQVGIGDHPAVTAVAAFDDDMALCVLAAMRDLGLAAPGDLAPAPGRVIVRESA
jgi:DNA-binding LacI/PurR family transcriptional regulator